MKEIRGLPHVILALALCFGVALLAAARRQERGKIRQPAVELSSYEVVVLELKKPFIQKNREGLEEKFVRAYLVTLKGRFPIDQAQGMELFIGDYRVPEYGGTRDGLYFRIYDPKLIRQLEGKEFRYRFASREVKSLNMRFSVERLQPLKTIKDQ